MEGGKQILRRRESQMSFTKKVFVEEELELDYLSWIPWRGQDPWIYVTRGIVVRIDMTWYISADIIEL